jgi:mono/diheme cytochrome c family protein
MKKIFPIVSMILFIFAFALGFNVPADNERPSLTQEGEMAPGFPEDVMEIMEGSCFGCHTAESTNKKGKIKLNFSEWDDWKTSKKIGKLDKICEEVEEGEMPPEKFMQKYPDKALSQNEVEIIYSWVDTEVDNLIGE